MSKSVTVAALTHDFVRKRSLVTLVWDDDPEQRVYLPVPYGCDIGSVRDEAEKAMRDLAAETAAILVKPAS
jgi:hypothetical protein